MKTGLVWDPLFILHMEDDQGHPESPKRLKTIYKALEEEGLDDATERLPIRAATDEEILSVHAERHFERVRSSEGRSHCSFDPDTYASAKSYQAAMAAAGSGIDLVDAILDCEIGNGFNICRPPGHHAMHDRLMGFCLLNNIAIAAEHLVSKRGLKRVAIVDFDVHHGNGTQDSFYEREDALYISTHRYPFYPGSGSAGELGSGPGEGYTLNLPFPAGLGDDEYLAAYYNLIIPVIEEYKPEFLLVSAGYDGHASDPLGGMSVTSNGMGQIGAMLVEAAGRVCDGRAAFFLEGGYNVNALAESVVLNIRSMMGEISADSYPIENTESEYAAEIVKQGKEFFSEYWDCLK